MKWAHFQNILSPYSDFGQFTVFQQIQYLIIQNVKTDYFSTNKSKSQRVGAQDGGSQKMASLELYGEIIKDMLKKSHTYADISSTLCQLGVQRGGHLKWVSGDSAQSTTWDKEVFCLTHLWKLVSVRQ